MLLFLFLFAPLTRIHSLNLRRLSGELQLLQRLLVGDSSGGEFKTSERGGTLAYCSCFSWSRCSTGSQLVGNGLSRLMRHTRPAAASIDRLVALLALRQFSELGIGLPFAALPSPRRTKETRPAPRPDCSCSMLYVRRSRRANHLKVSISTEQRRVDPANCL